MVLLSENGVLSWPNNTMIELFVRGTCLAAILLLASLLPSLSVRKGSISGIQTMLSGLMKPLSILVSRLQAWTFLFRGSQIIQDGFKRVSICTLLKDIRLLCRPVLMRGGSQSKGAPFFVDVPENRYHIVSSWEHIKEIDAASDGVLSLQGAAKEILQPKHTMTDFNWLDKRGAEGAPLLKTLRIDLAGHLPVLLPDIRRAMSGLLDDLYTSQATVNGK